MTLTSQSLVALGVAASFYGALQLATRDRLGEQHLTPLFQALRRIFRGDVPRDLAAETGDVFVKTGRKDRIGWQCVVGGFLFQFFGAFISLLSTLLGRL